MFISLKCYYVYNIDPVRGMPIDQGPGQDIFVTPREQEALSSIVIQTYEVRIYLTQRQLWQAVDMYTFVNN